MVIERTSEIKVSENLVMLVYGRGGVGKTSFAASAPKPLILDFENGTKYLGERGFDIDTIRLDRWLSAGEKGRLMQLIAPYKTIVIDPLGELMEKIINSPYIMDKKYRQTDGSLTMAGWGEAKKQIRDFVKVLRDSGKNVVIVSHVTTTPTEAGLQHRILVATGIRDEIPNMVDVISYLGVRKSPESEEVERLLYTPTQSDLFDSKDRTGRIPDSVVIGEHTGWQDFINSWRPLVRSAEAVDNEIQGATKEQRDRIMALSEKHTGNRKAFLEQASKNPSMTYLEAEELIAKASI